MIASEPWFVTRDAARALNIAVYPNGHIETAKVTRLVATDEKQLLRRTTPHLTRDTVQQLFQGRQPSLSEITESGLYKLIMRSDKPEARKFQDWVTREVLPAICKTHLVLRGLAAVPIALPWVACYGSPMRNQLTGNAGLYYASWQLSRRGWHVMPTVRNARGSDLIITDADESVFLGIQSKALGKRSPVPLGLSLNNLRSKWWVITVHANSDAPVSFILNLDEVKAGAYQDKTRGACWLQPPAYDRPEFREAWHRLDSASPAVG